MTKRLALATLALSLLGCETPPPIREAQELQPTAVDYLEEKYRDLTQRAFDDIQALQDRDAVKSFQMIVLANRGSTEAGDVVALEAIDVALNGIPLLDSEGNPVLDDSGKPRKREPGLVDAISEARAKRIEHQRDLDEIHSVHRKVWDTLYGIVGEWMTREGLSAEQRDETVSSIRGAAEMIGKEK